MATFTDDFNRVDSSAVGNSWTDVEVGPNDVKITSNKLAFTSAADFAVAYRSRTAGFGVNNTSIQASIVATTSTSLIFSVGGNTVRGGGGNAGNRLHIYFSEPLQTVAVYDGTTSKGSASITLSSATTYYFRWDIGSDYSMKVYYNSTGFTFSSSDVVLTITPFTPSSADGGLWKIGGDNNGTTVDDYTVYDTVQASTGSFTPKVIIF